MSKKKNQVPVDIAKAIWEEYANIILESYADQFDNCIQGLHTSHPIVVAQRTIIQSMRKHKFDFNRNIKRTP